MNDKYTSQAAKIVQSVAEIAKTAKISQVQIAEKTGFKQPAISRMFSGACPPKLHHLLKVAAAVGAEISVTIKGKKHITKNDM